MHSRRILLSSAAFGLTMLISTSVFAVDPAALTRVHTGTVVSVSADKLVTQGLSDKKKEHTYAIAAAVNVICETKPCKLTDIKAGDQVTVTVEKQQDGSTLATKIETKKVNS